MCWTCYIQWLCVSRWAYLGVSPLRGHVEMCATSLWPSMKNMHTWRRVPASRNTRSMIAYGKTHHHSAVRRSLYEECWPCRVTSIPFATLGTPRKQHTWRHARHDDTMSLVFCWLLPLRLPIGGGAGGEELPANNGRPEVSWNLYFYWFVSCWKQISLICEINSNSFLTKKGQHQFWVKHEEMKHIFKTLT